MGGTHHTYAKKQRAQGADCALLSRSGTWLHVLPTGTENMACRARQTSPCVREDAKKAAADACPGLDNPCWRQRAPLGPIGARTLVRICWQVAWSAKACGMLNGESGVRERRGYVRACAPDGLIGFICHVRTSWARHHACSNADKSITPLMTYCAVRRGCK